MKHTLGVCVCMCVCVRVCVGEWRIRVATALLLIKHSRRGECIFIVLVIDRKRISTQSTDRKALDAGWQRPSSLVGGSRGRVRSSRRGAIVMFE